MWDQWFEQSSAQQQVRNSNMYSHLFWGFSVFKVRAGHTSGVNSSGCTAVISQDWSTRFIILFSDVKFRLLWNFSIILANHWDSVSLRTEKAFPVLSREGSLRFVIHHFTSLCHIPGTNFASFSSSRSTCPVYHTPIISVAAKMPRGEGPKDSSRARVDPQQWLARFWTRSFTPIGPLLDKESNHWPDFGQERVHKSSLWKYNRVIKTVGTAF
jgi:hypothetical protein